MANESGDIEKKKSPLNLFSSKLKIPRPNVSFGIWESPSQHTVSDLSAEHKLYQKVYNPDVNSLENQNLLEEERSRKNWKICFFCFLVILFLILMAGLAILVIYLVDPCLIHVKCPPKTSSSTVFPSATSSPSLTSTNSGSQSSSPLVTSTYYGSLASSYFVTSSYSASLSNSPSLASTQSGSQKSSSSITSTYSGSQSTTFLSTTTSACTKPCYNQGSCQGSLCVCQQSIKTSDCSCSEAPCCNNFTTILVEDSYSFSSKNWTESGIYYLQCDWVFSASEGNLNLEITQIELNGFSDSLTIYNSSARSSTNLEAKFTSTNFSSAIGQQYFAPTTFLISYSASNITDVLDIKFTTSTSDICDLPETCGCGGNCTLTTTGSGFTCSCDPTSNCSIGGGPGNPCRSICDGQILCYNGGTCVPINNTDWNCECPTGYSGNYCQKGTQTILEDVQYNENRNRRRVF